MRCVMRCRDQHRGTRDTASCRARRCAWRLAGSVWLGLASLLARPPVNAAELVHFSTGIGDDDPIEIEMMRRLHNLQLVFALKGSGSYVADVRVTVYDRAGRTVLATVSPGPLFFATLAPGQYRIEADFSGRPQARTTTIGQSGRRDLQFYWDGE